MTLYYCYDPQSMCYTGKFVPMSDFDRPTYCTTTPPLESKQQMISVWLPDEEKWVYQEHSPAPGASNIMDDILTYQDIRAMEYPPMTDYLDAYVKQDTAQLQAYQDACLAVKTRWPKTMVPITRREYYQQTLGMRLIPVDNKSSLYTEAVLDEPLFQPLPL